MFNLQHVYLQRPPKPPTRQIQTKRHLIVVNGVWNESVDVVCDDTALQLYSTYAWTHHIIYTYAHLHYMFYRSFGMKY